MPKLKIKKYGYPYRGSKSKVAPILLDAMPSAEYFYDLFAGGCAITHCALLSGKFRKVIANDIQGTPSLFLDAINGKFKNESRWISREDFLKLKDSDHLVRWIWSFGNNGKDYMFSKAIEGLKRQAHEYLFANGYDGSSSSRLLLIKQFKTDKNLHNHFRLQQLEQLERLQQLERLEQLQQLQQLQQLEQLECLEVSQVDYAAVEIQSNSVVYCDIPYGYIENSKEQYYSVTFNRQGFYDWANECPHPVYFSSVHCNDNRFTCILEVPTTSKMSAKTSHSIVEKLYWNGKCNVNTAN